MWNIKLDVKRGEKTHWVAHYKKQDEIEYFDGSCDLSPPIKLQKYLKGCNIVYNYTNYQKYNAYICGRFVLTFYKV